MASGGYHQLVLHCYLERENLWFCYSLTCTGQLIWGPLVWAESGYVFESICTGAAQACGCEFALTCLNLEVCMEGSPSGSAGNAVHGLW